MMRPRVSGSARRTPLPASSAPGARHGGTDGHPSGGLRATAIKAAIAIANVGALVMLIGIASVALLSGDRS